MEKEKERELKKLQKERERAMARAKECLQYAETIRKREMQIAEDDILAEIRRMQDAGESLIDIVNRIKSMQDMVNDAQKEREVIQDVEI